MRLPFWDLYLFKTGIGMRSSLIIVCINSVFPFISFPFSVGLALTGFLYGIFMIVCVVIKSQRIFEPCPFPSPNTWRCRQDGTRLETAINPVGALAEVVRPLSSCPRDGGCLCEDARSQ